MRRQAFTHELEFQFTALGQKLSQVAQVEPFGDWVMVKICHTTSDNVDPQTVVSGGGLMMLRDTRGKLQLSNNPLPLDSVSGRAQRPFILASEMQFSKMSTIYVEITNTGLAAQLIRLSLHGYYLVE